jgi:hypothetical protein
VAARLFRRGLTSLRGHVDFTRFGLQNLVYTVGGRGFTGPVKIFTVRTSLRDLLYTCFSTEIVKVDNFTGLTTFTVAASVALRTSRSVHVTCFSIYLTCKAFVCPQLFLKKSSYRFNT